ncbi:MAG: DUF2059 domain-containing protein [Verrucomicrobiota bacterium]
MKYQIITLTLLTVSLFTPLTEASSMEKAKELMRLMEVRKSIDASRAQISQMNQQMIASQGLSEEASKQAIAAAEQSMEASFNAMEEINWEGIFGEIYSSVFTEEELQGLIDFYKSPVGQKFIKKQPELQAATMQKMQVEMMKIMPQIQSDVMNAIQEAKK